MEQTSFPFPPPDTPVKLDQHRLDLLDRARDEGVGIVHCFNPHYPFGGLTVAFKRCSPYKSGKMVEVALASCSDKDSFNRKVGSQRALELFFSGRTVELPLLHSGADPRDLNVIVKELFTTLHHDYS